MKYVQVCGTVVCVLLSIITIQLRGLRPITMADINSNSKDIGARQKLVESLPLTDVLTVYGTVGTEVTNSVDVRVENRVPVPVQIER